MSEHRKSRRRYIAAVDIGTTTIRCYIYDHKSRVVASVVDKVPLLYPHQGWVEIKPEDLWSRFQTTVKSALQEADLKPSDIAAIGLATQRCTFTTWDKETGKEFHNFITWKDLRADRLVHSWNNSLSLRGLRIGSTFMHFITRNPRYLSGSVFKLMNAQVIMRLLWVSEHVPELKRRAQESKALFGTIDTWLLYKLTKGRVYATDYSNASATGFFDPYTMDWGAWAFKMLNFPIEMGDFLPELRDSAGDFGAIAAEIFGEEIPIRCVVSDQGASLFGSCCFQPGDIRLTMGTGSFLSCNTGRKPHASVAGLYPVIGWKIGEDLTYVAEGNSSDTGTAIEWCKKIGLFKNVDEIVEIVTSVPDSHETYFIPAFSGIQAPVNDDTAATGFVGLKPSTTKEHMLRAVVESLVFRIQQLYSVMSEETGRQASIVKVDGGVSQNDFVMQLVADLTNVQIERATSSEMSALGAAYMAGFAAGVWKDKREFLEMRRVERLFTPDVGRWIEYGPLYVNWKKAMERLQRWY